MLQSDSLPEWSIWSDFGISCDVLLLLLPPGERRGCGSGYLPPTESRRGCASGDWPPTESPQARSTASLACRIQLSHCCLLKLSLACSRWACSWEPLLKVTRRKFLAAKNIYKNVGAAVQNLLSFYLSENNSDCHTSAICTGNTIQCQRLCSCKVCFRKH